MLSISATGTPHCDSSGILTFLDSHLYVIVAQCPGHSLARPSCFDFTTSIFHPVSSFLITGRDSIMHVTCYSKLRQLFYKISLN